MTTARLEFHLPNPCCYLIAVPAEQEHNAAMYVAILAANTFAQAPPPVVGGELVEQGKWEDATAIFKDSSNICTGTLIAPDLVLTAGHCNIGPTHVTLATTDAASESAERIDIESATSYPDAWNTYDVAVLVLQSEAQTEPRLLARDCVPDQHLSDGAAVAVVGFGAYDEWAVEQDGLLRQAFTTVSDHDCSEPDRGCNEEVQPSGELIAGGGGVDSCSGDSGGPLYLLTDDGDFLIGITSRAALPSSVPCGDGGIYVRADAIADWVETTTGKSLERPDCPEDYNYAPVPTAAAVDIERNGIQRVALTVDDPNEEDTHTVSIGTPPQNGESWVDSDGTVFYKAPAFWTGSESITIEVADNGVPARSNTTIVQVKVSEPFHSDETKNCRSISPITLFSWILILPLLRRRTR